MCTPPRSPLPPTFYDNQRREVIREIPEGSEIDIVLTNETGAKTQSRRSSGNNSESRNTNGLKRKRTNFKLLYSI